METVESTIPEVKEETDSKEIEEIKTITEENNKEILSLTFGELKISGENNNDAQLMDQVFGPNTGCLIKLKNEATEFISGIEVPNKYDIFLPNGLRLIAIEESTFVSRVIFGSQRSFTIKICFASNKVELLKIERPLSILTQELTVYDSLKKDIVIGKIIKSSWFTKNFEIHDNKGLVYRIHSPFFTFWTFNVFNQDGLQVGVIKKKWAGLLKEFYDDSDNFIIEYPKDATPPQKSLLLAASFLLEFMYFDNSQKTNS